MRHAVMQEPKKEKEDSGTQPCPGTATIHSSFTLIGLAAYQKLWLITLVCSQKEAKESYSYTKTW